MQIINFFHYFQQEPPWREGFGKFLSLIFVFQVCQFTKETGTKENPKFWHKPANLRPEILWYLRRKYQW